MQSSDDQIRVIIADLRQATAREVARVAFAVHARITQNTPVDTGWARANWVVSVGAPWDGTLGDRKSVDATTGPASVRSLFSYNLAQGDVFISNHVPYIQRLNDGWSKQAPAQFVESAIEDGIAATLGGGA